ncbi:hypothetical protein OIU77_009880 [Salix suchowensis]|uniref:Uncharacterized protein n=1 Tax=Salix suchowensis TaxID=1278906 RepID=A0ABQ9A7I6_9ROSI|nr:hypothetical protein OIU77_009880 [Salix suchowensis]
MHITLGSIRAFICIPLHIDFRASKLGGLTQGTKIKLTFTFLTEAEMLTR